MRSVDFGDLNSYNDLNLMLSKKVIGAPAPKLLHVDLPGGDGSIDYTEYFGEIHYENRILTFEFTSLSTPNKFSSDFTRILNLLNGRRMKITLSEDPDYYYIGRITVNEWQSEKRIGKVVISVEAEPYKYKSAVTVVSLTASAKTVINCQNARMKVQPKLTFSSDTIVSFGNFSKSLSAGVHIDDDIIFVEGENILTVTPSSSGVITIEYQEGDL